MTLIPFLRADMACPEGESTMAQELVDTSMAVKDS